MIPPDVRRTVRLKRTVTGQKIIEALRKVAEEVEGKYVQELMRDHDNLQKWNLGICGVDPHQDVNLRTEHPSLGYLGVQPNGIYDLLGVGNTHWHDYHDQPKVYNSFEIITAVVNVQLRLEELLNK